MSMVKNYNSGYGHGHTDRYIGREMSRISLNAANLPGYSCGYYDGYNNLKYKNRPQNIQFQYDNSGVGHNWKNIDLNSLPANIIIEIEGEIINEGKDNCDDFVGSNGLHYRWFVKS